MNILHASGNLGGDMEIAYTKGGTAIGTVSMAVTHGFGDKQKTMWVKCKLFGKQAESLTPYLTKGSKPAFVGRFYIDEWTGDDGIKRTTPTLEVMDVDLPRREGPAVGKQHHGFKNEATNNDGSYKEAVVEDDIPF